MFNHSSQRQNWLFKDASELAEIRKKTNSNYVRKQNQDVSKLLITIVIKYVFIAKFKILARLFIIRGRKGHLDALRIHAQTVLW